jgi:hypothetical protein
VSKNPDVDDPIERFCQVIERLPEADRNQVISWCHLGVGPVTVGHIFAPRLDSLRSRLRFLVEAGLAENFLIPSLCLFVIEAQRRAAAQDEMRDSIAAQEERIAMLRSQLLLPVEERRSPISDDELSDLIEKLEQHLANRPTQRDDARAAASRAAATDADLARPGD